MKTAKHLITLTEFDFENGTIPFSLLTRLASQLVRVSEASLRLFVEGSSISKKRAQPTWIRKSVDFHLTGVHHGSTVLEVEAPMLEETLEDIQLPLFKELGDESIGQNTAISLSMLVYEKAVSGDSHSALLDKHILKEFAGLSNILKGNGTITLDFVDMQRKVVLDRTKIETIRELEENTPESIKTKISGLLDIMKFTNRQLELKIGKDRSRVILPEKMQPDELVQFFGKDVTIIGRANFNPAGGVSNIELQKIQLAKPEDAYFKQLPQPILPGFHTHEAIAQHRGGSKLQRLFGQWPGDEEIEEILSEIE